MAPSGTVYHNTQTLPRAASTRDDNRSPPSQRPDEAERWTQEGWWMGRRLTLLGETRRSASYL